VAVRRLNEGDRYFNWSIRVKSEIVDSDDLSEQMEEQIDAGRNQRREYRHARRGHTVIKLMPPRRRFARAKSCRW
jgi:hypothetical protein